MHSSLALSCYGAAPFLGLIPSESTGQHSGLKMASDLGDL